MYAAFVEQGLNRLDRHGMLGAITSRTGFFLLSVQKWREEVLLGEAKATLFADLGYGVLDTAIVETAAYCLVKCGKVEPMEKPTMPSVSLREAQARLPELIAELVPGEALPILRDGTTIATLVKTWVPSSQPRQAGSAKDILHFMADDFDAPLEDFDEYMP